MVDELGFYAPSPSHPIIVVADKKNMSMETLYEWTWEELLAKCEAWGVNINEIETIFRHMRDRNQTMLFIDLNVYHNALREGK